MLPPASRAKKGVENLLAGILGEKMTYENAESTLMRLLEVKHKDGMQLHRLAEAVATEAAP